MTITNPYLDEHGKPQLRNSFCAFLDVLGFSAHIESSFRDGNGKIALDRFYGVFTEQLQTVLNPDEEEYSHWAIKVFTDNIVLAYPRTTWHSEPELADILRKIGLYQLKMTLEGFFIRGGLSTDELFMDESTVFGPALLESYAIESKMARDPRVVLSQNTMDVLSQHIGFYNPKEWAPQNDLVLQDADGKTFIHYLSHVVFHDDSDSGNTVDTDTLAKHRDIVIENIEKHRGSPAVWSKYRWIADYHNFFVDECISWEGCEDDMKIDQSHLTIGPSRLKHTK